MAVDLEVASKEYFGSSTPLSKKISVDIQSTREAYRELWHSLSTEDQHQVIDESIICPSAVIKYAHLPSPEIKNYPNVHTWFTKSQLDLFNQNQYNAEKLSAHNVYSETTNEEQSKKVICNETLDTNRGKEISADKTSVSKVPKPSVLKPKIPPPPPPSKNRASSTEVESSDDSSVISGSTDIPKTGFDFLDNW